MGRPARVAFAVLAAVGVLLALDAGTPASGANVASAASSAVRFANLTDDGGSVDLFVDGRLRVKAMLGGLTTDFMVIPAGQHRVGVTAAADAGDLAVAAGTAPTVLLLGPSAHPSVVALPETADSSPSVRVVNMTALAVHVSVGGEEVASDPASSSLVPVKAGAVAVVVTDLAGSPLVRTSLRVRATESVTAVVTGGTGALAIHGLAPHTITPDALALHADAARPSRASGANPRRGDWIRQLLAGLVIVLVFAATLSSLAVFRVDSLEDRVRNRMR